MENSIELINYGKKILKKYNIINPTLDAEILLSKASNISRERLIINFKDKIKSSQVIKYFKFLNERKKRVPIAYIINEKEFWEKIFYINRSVLIPRPESELLVDQVLRITNKYSKKTILDIGTGSGCLIISVLLNRRKWKGVALDISKEALKIAKTNAKMQHIDNRIRFINSDIDKFFSNKYDLILTNPPYIKKTLISTLDKDVKNFEPLVALDGGLDGLLKINNVIKKSKRLLRKNGKIILEFDDSQLFNIKKKLMNNKFYINEVLKDLSGKNRCIVATSL